MKIHASMKIRAIAALLLAGAAMAGIYAVAATTASAVSATFVAPAELRPVLAAAPLCEFGGMTHTESHPVARRCR